MNPITFLKACAVIGLAAALAGCDETGRVTLAVGRLAMQAAEAQIDHIDRMLHARPDESPVAASQIAGYLGEALLESQEALAVAPASADTEVDIPSF